MSDDYALEYKKRSLEQKQDLLKFLLDINCLSKLEQYANIVNIFDILKVERAEIRHSNVLAWLLDPNENHGLGDSVLRGFIAFAAKSGKKM